MPSSKEFFQIADTLLDSFLLGFSSLFFVASAGALLLGLWMFMSSEPADDQSSKPLIGTSVVGMVCAAVLYWLSGVNPKDTAILVGHDLAQLGLYTALFGVTLELAWRLFRKGRKTTKDYAVSGKDGVIFPRVIVLSMSFFSVIGGGTAIVKGLFL